MYIQREEDTRTNTPSVFETTHTLADVTYVPSTMTPECMKDNYLSWSSPYEKRMLKLARKPHYKMTREETQELKKWELNK